MTASKPVTVWVAWHRKEQTGGLCVTSDDYSVTEARMRTVRCKYGPRTFSYARRFVAIDSLPLVLREKVREACR